MSTPPVPATRKVKLVTSLKGTLSEQSTKLQTKHQLENDLLEDIRTFTKLRATAEKDYAQAMLKITSQLLAKFQPKDDQREEEMRTPYGVWRQLLEDSESMANAHMEISQTLQGNVADSIKTLKSERTSILKKCSTLVEKLHEELQVSAAELAKMQKTYSDFQKITTQSREAASDAQDKVRKGAVGLFSSKAKLEKNLSKATERKDVAEKRSTIARNEYLLSLAALNGHQRKYYSLDLPDVIAVQDGSIYEDFKKYYSIIATAEKDVCRKCIENLTKLESSISVLNRAVAIECFLKQNSVFTKCQPHEFVPLFNDTISTFSEEFSAGLPLNKEARKWTLRLTKEQKNIRKKTKELNRLRETSKTDTTTSNDSGTDGTKSTEQLIEELTEEIRHLEVLKTKSESRVEALREAGVNVDEWLQGALGEDDDDDGDNKEADSQEGDGFQDYDDEFGDEEWDDPSPTNLNYSDDALSTNSSIDTRSIVAPAVAIYSFQATSQEELTITDGEELELLEREGDGWCKTRNKAGQIGFVPEAYIEVLGRRGTTASDDTASHTSSLTGSINVGETNPENSVLFAPPIVVEETTPQIIGFAKAMYDYEACEEEELSFQEGDVIMIVSKMVDDDDGWWEGILKGRRGVFPSIVVEETKPPDPQEGAHDYPVTRPRVYTADTYATFPRAKLQKTLSLNAEERDMGL